MIKKVFITVLFLTIITCFLTACSDTGQPPIETQEENLFSDMNGMDNSDAVFSSVIIETGIQNGPKSMRFVYDGNPIEFDYYMDAEGTCDLGLEIYVNGFSQPYFVEGDETYMHVVHLDDEMKSFHVSFQPVDGQKGEEAELLFISVYNPIVARPDENGYVNFGNNQKMSSPLFWSIGMERDCLLEKLPVENMSSAAVYRKFSKEERDSFIHSNASGSRKDDLDYLHLELWNEQRIDDSIIYTKENEKVSLKLYGGPEAIYRVSYYCDFELLEINGKTYYDFSVKKGQETSWDIDLEDIPVGSNFYAMAIPLDPAGDWVKSSSYYIADTTQISSETDAGKETQLLEEADGILNESAVMEKCIVLGNSKIARIYADPFKNEFEVPVLIGFDIYDLGQKKILANCDLRKYGISSMNLQTGVNEDYFYIFDYTQSSWLFFSYDGSFVKQIILPFDADYDRAVCLSEDLSVLIYQSREPNGEGTGYPLIALNMESGEKRILYETTGKKNAVCNFEKLYLNRDKTRMAFKGQTIPTEGEQSIDCYGYMNLKDGELELYAKNEIQAAGVGEHMMISDTKRPYGVESSGSVLLFDLNTLEKTEISTVTKEESQFVYPIREDLFFTVVDRNTSDGKKMASIRQYRDGQHTGTMEYLYESGLDSIGFLDYDENTEMLFLQSYSTTELNYVTIQVPFLNFIGERI